MAAGGLSNTSVAFTGVYETFFRLQEWLAYRHADTGSTGIPSEPILGELHRWAIFLGKANIL